MTFTESSAAMTGDQRSAFASGNYEVSGRAAFVTQDSSGTIHVHYKDGSWTCFYPETFRKLAVKKLEATPAAARVTAPPAQSNEE